MKYQIWFDHEEQKSREDFLRPDATVISDYGASYAAALAAENHLSDGYTEMIAFVREVETGKWFQVALERGWRGADVPVQGGIEEVYKHFEVDL